MRDRLLWLVLLLSPLAAWGGINEWTYVGFGPEVVLDVQMHPLNPMLLYAGLLASDIDSTRNGGLLLSTDRGQSWDTLGFRHQSVWEIRFDSQNPQIIWLELGQRGLRRTSDNGLTWEDRSNGLPLGGPDQHTPTDLALSPFDSNLVLCAGTSYWGSGWLYRSTDAGLTWARVVVPSPVGSNASFHKIAFDPQVPGRAYANDSRVEILSVSTDSGATFLPLTAEANPDYLLDFAFDPLLGDRLWALGSHTASSSTDGGSTWQTDTLDWTAPHFLDTASK